MERWTDLGQVPDLARSVVTIGNFDGVHRGHRAVLKAMIADARRIGGSAIAVTFDPHPAQVHRPGAAPALITGLADRLDLMAETGLDGVLVVRYTPDFASQAPEEFVARYLVDGLHAAMVVVGRDVRFGRRNVGDLVAMEGLGREHGFEVQVVEDVHGAPDAERRWSSTWVRELLAAGDVVGAEWILGRPHRMRGVVVRGDARGRKLGFPTANLGSEAVGMAPADGVYAGWMRRVGHPADEQDGYLPVAISIGTNPTFDGVARRVEAHVPDRTDLDLYDEEIVVEFVERLRPMMRFTSAEALIAQMVDDVATTRSRLAGGPFVLGAPTAD